MKSVNIYATITIIIVVLFSIYYFDPIDINNKEHYHQVVSCQYAEGFKSYGLVFCHTEKAQVSGDIHRYNQRGDKFFAGELNHCQAPIFK